MADFTITIRVSGSVDGQAFAWTRTAIVNDIEEAIYGLNASTQANTGLGSDEAGGFPLDGHHSYSGVAVACFVHNNPATIVTLNPIDPTGTVYCSVLMAPGIPMIYYGGAGTGFTGAFNSSNTGTDTPTVDMVGTVSTVPFIGTGTIGGLIGLKPVS